MLTPRRVRTWIYIREHARYPGGRTRHDRNPTYQLLLLLLFFMPCDSLLPKASITIPLAKFTRAQLRAAIEPRMKGVHELIRMAGPRVCEGSVVARDVNEDLELFQMRGEAAKSPIRAGTHLRSQKRSTVRIVVFGCGLPCHLRTVPNIRRRGEHWFQNS